MSEIPSPEEFLKLRYFALYSIQEVRDKFSEEISWMGEYRIHILDCVDDAPSNLHKPIIVRRKSLIGFFKWLNSFEELQYTKKGIIFYVDEYLKSINNR